MPALPLAVHNFNQLNFNCKNILFRNF